MALVGVEQVSKALNVSARRVQQLSTKEGMPRAERGQYDLGQCMLWYIRYLQKQIAGRSSGEEGSVTSLMTERTKQARQQSERMQMANLKARGEVLLASDVAEQERMAIAYLTQALTAIPQRITTDEQTQARLEEEIILARNRFANDLASIARARKPVAAARRTGKGKAKAKPRRVGGRRKSPAAGDPGTGTVAQ